MSNRGEKEYIISFDILVRWLNLKALLLNALQCGKFYPDYVPFTCK